MAFTVRALDLELDLSRVAEIRNAAKRECVTPQILREWKEQEPSDFIGSLRFDGSRSTAGAGVSG